MIDDKKSTHSATGESAYYLTIAKRKWDDKTRPLLSIQCLTYNHEKYISECIDGFLKQKTNFPVEIIVHDDASTDGTAEILRKYQKLYPDAIKLILQTSNQYSAGIDPNNQIIPMIQGRYIARCEGDDFWTDANKLQTQVDFLENHPEYVVSCHDSSVIDENGNLISPSSVGDHQKKDKEAEELILNKCSVQLRSMVYRNVIKQTPWEKSIVTNSDTFLISLLGHFGKSKFHHDISPACYRHHPNCPCKVNLQKGHP